MTRLEENKMLIKEIEAKTKLKPEGTYEEMVVFGLDVIASLLADISKSLAILAHKAESEEAADEQNQ